MALDDFLVGGGAIMVLLMVLIGLLLILAPIGIWFALSRLAQAQEATAKALARLADNHYDLVSELAQQQASPEHGATELSPEARRRVETPPGGQAQQGH